jgi:hypothetical protein
MKRGDVIIDMKVKRRKDNYFSLEDSFKTSPEEARDYLNEKYCGDKLNKFDQRFFKVMEMTEKEFDRIFNKFFKKKGD